MCLQVTDLLPGLRKLRNLLPEHGCLLLSPGNFWQNDRERFHADRDIIGTIHQHEPKTLQTSATLKGRPCIGWVLCSPHLLAPVLGGGSPGGPAMLRSHRQCPLCLQTCCSVFLGSTVG